MMDSGKFATSVNCIDGRIQLPLIHWIKEKYDIDYVDTITEPGVDKLFSNPNQIKKIKSNVLFSVKNNKSKLIIISGHHDCTENPVTKNVHLTQIKNAMNLIQFWDIPVKVIGTWVNEDWEIEVIKN